MAVVHTGAGKERMREKKGGMEKIEKNTDRQTNSKRERETTVSVLGDEKSTMISPV